MSVSLTNGTPVLTETPGHELPPRIVQPPYERRSQPPTDARPAHRQHDRLGLRLLMPAPVLLYGLGTTGTEILGKILALLLLELGRVTKAGNYYAFDGASNGASHVVRQFLCLDIGGCGTDPRRGQEAFLRHYGRIRRIVLRQMQGLSPLDPEVLVAYPPRDVLDIYLFGGCGGSSGGMFDPMITLVHDVAQECRIRDPRVNVVMVGPEMPVRDRTRSTLPEQTYVICNTFACLLVKRLSEMSSTAILYEERPDGTTFELPACRRVWSLDLYDQSNGEHDWPTVDSLTDMIAEKCFLQIFTAMGKYLGDRTKDREQLGVSGRPFLP